VERGQLYDETRLRRGVDDLGQRPHAHREGDDADRPREGGESEAVPREERGDDEQPTGVAVLDEPSDRDLEHDDQDAVHSDRHAVLGRREPGLAHRHRQPDRPLLKDQRDEEGQPDDAHEAPVAQYGPEADGAVGGRGRLLGRAGRLLGSGGRFHRLGGLGLRQPQEDEDRADHRHPRLDQEPGEIADLGDEPGRHGGHGEAEVDGPVVEGEGADTVLGPDDVGHHRLHGGPGRVAGHADEERDSGDRDRVVHEPEERDGHGGRGLCDQQRRPPPQPVGHHATAQ
jgi:hypothetical protein